MDYCGEDFSTGFHEDASHLGAYSEDHNTSVEANHEESLPVNLTQTGASSDESDNNDSDEDESGVHEEEVDKVTHTPEFAQKESQEPSTTTHNIEEPKTRPPLKAEKPQVESGEESDYEEPKKVNGTASATTEEHVVSNGHEEGEDEDEHEHEITEEPKESAEQQQEEEEEESVRNKCLKCDELINSNEEEVDASDSHFFHVNCFRCAQCNCPLESEAGFRLIDDKPYCNSHSPCLSSGDTVSEAVEEATLPTTKQGEIETPATEPSHSNGSEDQNGQDEDSHRATPPRSEDVLPPTGSAKRLVEQWSNIEAHKPTQNFNTAQADSAPKYPPNTAKKIAAKFSAGITDEQQSEKPKAPADPNEQWPSQGQARGLIAKFSAMHA